MYSIGDPEKSEGEGNEEDPPMPAYCPIGCPGDLRLWWERIGGPVPSPVCLMTDDRMYPIHACDATDGVDECAPHVCLCDPSDDSTGERPPPGT